MSRSLALCAFVIAACGTERIDPRAGESRARPLGMFSSERDADPLVEARLALARDAFRREARFLDQVAPGYLLSASSPAQREIDAGSFSPDDVYQLGAQLFHYEFTPSDGLGSRASPTLRRFHVGFLGGPDAQSCRTCHWRGGIAGAGDAADNAYFQGDGERQDTALERNPRALVGAGWVEILATEMSAELAGRREAARAQAQSSGVAVRAPLSAKGVSFGALTAQPDGTVSLDEVEGIDGDLVLRPFGWKGRFATIRDATEDALRVHLGMQSSQLVAQQGELPAVMGPHGLPDPDGDGVVDEISEGQLSVLTLFVALSEAPVVELPNTPFAPVSLVAQGEASFEEIGCATCHTPRHEVESGVFELAARQGEGSIAIDLVSFGAMPRLAPSVLDGALVLPLYSDLKRHDMGPELAEVRADGHVEASLFVTPPLWGVARSRPYLHDGRAQTIHEAIIQHGGEATEARDRYVELGEAGQGPIRVFLATLTREKSYVAQ